MPAVASERADDLVLQDHLVGLIRAFGLHHPERTPCGEPVPVSDAHALMELARDALSQTELAARLRLEKSTVSRLVRQLEARGWVRRKPDPTDGRVAMWSLTPSGRRTASQIEAARRKKFGRVMRAVPEEEREGVLRALKVLVEAMSREGLGDS